MDHDVVSVLLDILVVLVAAKVAAEIAERIRIPAVVGEIAAGVLIGPSVLDLVGGGDVLRTLGELGVVLLLLEVGMEMDLAELGKVGRTSLLVASIGVVAPLVLGLGAMTAIGDDFNTALFVAAALTATSVGITARVFGDLRALATTEARVVLGAAVADDVMGLVVLTVVVRVVTEGTVSALDVVKILGVAVAFLVVGGLLALWVAPRLFDQVERRAQSAGTIVAIALAFTLALAELADAAQLAVVVGAFLAGLALGRTTQAPRIRRELAPVGHLFIPVFFLQIGIDVDVSKFGQLTVLRDAAILLVVAVVGKLVAAAGTIGTPSDKLLIGLGMLPRGEVGLIFATIGLGAGVLGDDLYAALLIVVLATTLVTPVLLRRRYDQIEARARRSAAATGPTTRHVAPPGGWVHLIDGQVALAAVPDQASTAEVAFVAARLIARARPSEALLESLGQSRGEALPWSDGATKALIALLAEGNARSWRFLDALDVLPRALPELAADLQSRRDDPFQLDPMRLHRWETLESLGAVRATERGRAEWNELIFPERVQLAAFLIDVIGERPDALPTTRRFLDRLHLGGAAEHVVATVVFEPDLLLDLARHHHSRDEASVLRLAAHLRTPETARASYLVASARANFDPLLRSRLDDLYDLVQAAFDDPRVGPEAEQLAASRRAHAARLLADPAAVVYIENAPRTYTLSHDPDVIARHADLLARWSATKQPPRLFVAVSDSVPARDGVAGACWLDVVADDVNGLLARVASVLAREALDVRSATAATWPNGPALESFLIQSSTPIDDDGIRTLIDDAIDAPLVTEGVADVEVTFDDRSSAWYTICTVTAPDSPGLLAALGAAFTAAGVDVHSSTIATHEGRASDRFEISAGGTRLSDRVRAQVRQNIDQGVELPGRRTFLRRLTAHGHAALASVFRQPADADSTSSSH